MNENNRSKKFSISKPNQEDKTFYQRDKQETRLRVQLSMQNSKKHAKEEMAV